MSARVHDAKLLYRKLAEALPSGGLTRSGHITWDWDVSGDCISPYKRSMAGRMDKAPGRDQPATAWAPGDQPALHVDLQARCRHCDPCLRHRARIWFARSRDEVAASSRTWFGTLTVRPENRYRTLCAVTAQENLTGEQLFRAKNEQYSGEITKFLKRVRKESSASLRFLIVCEAHKDGEPHYHMLVHEVGLGVVKQRTLRDQWKLGFSRWKLVEDQFAASYVCKYLHKSSLARVRASIDYGTPPTTTKPPTETICMDSEKEMKPAASIDHQSIYA